MSYRHRQRGMSMWSMMFLVVVLGGLFLVGLKLIPVYLESFKIDSALQSLVADPTMADASAKEITTHFRKRIEIDDVTHVYEGNFKDTLSIEKKGKKFTVSVHYKVLTPLVGNLSILAVFNKEVHN